VTGTLEVPCDGKLPIFTPIVEGGAGGASPGSEVKTTGPGVGELGTDGTVTGTEKAGPGRIGFWSVPTRFASGSMLIGTGGVQPDVAEADVASPSRTRTFENRS
jgi:hypothetical protein